MPSTRSGTLRNGRSVTLRDEAPKVSKERYPVIVGNANEAIVVVQDGVLRYINPKVEEMTGFKREELIGTPFTSFVHPEDREMLLARRKKRLQGCKEYETYSFRIVDKGGHVRCVEIKPVLILWEDKPATLGFLSDITEREREEKLQRALYEIAIVTSYAEDLRDFYASIHRIVGELIYAKNLYIALLDKSSQMLTFPYFVDEHESPPSPRPLRRGLTEYVIRTGNPLLCSPELFRQLERRDEVELMGFPAVSWLGVPLKNNNDTVGVLAVQSYAEDIQYNESDKELLTFVSQEVSRAIERKQVEERLKESEMIFRKLFQAATDAIILADGEGKIVCWNRGAQRIFGYGEKEALGKSLTMLIPERFREAHLREIKCALSKGPNNLEGKIRESFGLRKGGKEFPVEISYAAWKVKEKLFLACIIRDLPQRQREEEALRESEERFRSIVENSREGILIVDDSYRFVYVNDQLCEILGYPKEEIIGHDFREFLDENSKKLVAQRYRKRQRGEKVPPRYEFNILRKNGELRRVEISSAVVRSPDGNVRTVAQILDVTERKRVEDKIKKQAQFLRDILDSLTHPFYVIDVNDYTIKIANQVIGEVDPSKPITCYEKTHHSDKPCSLNGEKCTLEDLKRSRKPVIVEHIHYDKEGNPRHFEVHGYPIFDDNGNISQMIEYCLDITDRKKAQEKLKKSIRELEKAITGTIDAMARIVEMRDPYTAGHQQRVAKLACAIAKEMGLPKEKIQGINMASLIHDIGKIYIPAEILSKPSPLSSIEKTLIEAHPQVGYDILKNVQFPWRVAEIVLQHHERLNGSGYPQGLKADEILLEARILGIADVVEAMSSHRPYRPAVGIERALAEIEKNKGTLYDPNVVDACLRLFKKRRFSFH